MPSVTETQVTCNLCSLLMSYSSKRTVQKLELACTFHAGTFLVNIWEELWERMEKAMAPHSSTLAWEIPWAEEPGRLQSMGSRRVGHDWATSLSLFTFTPWRRKWQPTPVLLPGKSHGQRSLVGYSPWGHTVRQDWMDLGHTFFKRLHSVLLYKLYP